MKEQRVLGVDLSNIPDSSYYRVSFKNHGFHTKEHVNSAITKDGEPIGIITEVSDDIVTFKEVEMLQEQVKNNNYDKEKLLEAIEDYKWLLEFKPFEEIVNTNAVSTEALLDACRAYAKWYGYTQCEMGLQKILFFDG